MGWLNPANTAGQLIWVPDEHVTQRDWVRRHDDGEPVPRLIRDAVAGSIARGHKHTPQTTERAVLEHEIRGVNSRHWLDADNTPEGLELAARRAGQQQLAFTERERRANIRIELAQYLERVVCPHTFDRKVLGMPERLRLARIDGVKMQREGDGKEVFLWEHKTGSPLLDPDDARQEGSRLKRRVIPVLMDHLRAGMRVYPATLTRPDVPAGKLEHYLPTLFRRLAAVRKVRRDGKLRFPMIKGWFAVQEAPLSWDRDWHPHLNVMLVCDGYLSVGDFQQWWSHIVQFANKGRPITYDPVRDALEGRTTEQRIEATLRELVKYPVRTVGEKSGGGKRAQSLAYQMAVSKGETLPPDAVDRTPPPMTEWTAAEWLEWWNAHQRFRRTRTNGCLYKLPKPEKESLSDFRAVATVHFRKGRYWECSSLVRSILGDKSVTPDTRDVYRAACRRVIGPPDNVNALLATVDDDDRAWQTVKSELYGTSDDR